MTDRHRSWCAIEYVFVVSHSTSLTVDGESLHAVGLLPGETVLSTNESNGDQLIASVTRGRRSMGGRVLNGPLARHGTKGDRLSIYRYNYLPEGKLHPGSPTPAFVDGSGGVAKHSSGPRLLRE